MDDWVQPTLWMITGAAAVLFLGFAFHGVNQVRLAWKRKRATTPANPDAGGDWTSERSRITLASDDEDEDPEQRIVRDFRIMLDISPHGAATMKFSDATYLPDTQDATYMIELARQMISFSTGRGYWVVTGVYRNGEVITFEHIDGKQEHAGHSTENAASGD